MSSYGRCIRILAGASAIFTATMVPPRSLGQETSGEPRPSADGTPTDDVKTLGQLVLQLQTQVQSLNARVQVLESNEKAALDESASLRAQLAVAKSFSATSTEAHGSYGTGTFSKAADSANATVQTAAP